jgi:hypothetical protein
MANIATEQSIHARCDQFWGWNTYDERRLYSPSFRPYFSTRSNALLLTVIRLVLGTFVFAGSAQVSTFFTSGEPTYIHAIFLSNHGMWTCAAYLACSGILTVAQFFAIETRNSEMMELISPSLPQEQAKSQTLLQLFVLGWKRAIMILLSIAIFEETIILPLYWFLLYPSGRDSFTNWVIIMTHGVGYAVILIDVLILSSHRLVFRHWIAALASALFYLLLNLIFTFTYGGYAPYGSILSWRSIWTLIWIIVCIFLGFIGYFYMQSLIRLRMWCVKSITCCDPNVHRISSSVETTSSPLNGNNDESVIGVDKEKEDEESRWQRAYPRTFSDDSNVIVCDYCAKKQDIRSDETIV